MENIKYNKSLANNYNKYHEREVNMFDMQVYKIINYLQLNDQKTVIDVGCGSGRLLQPISHNVKTIYGVEYSENMYDNTTKLKIDNSVLFNMDFSLFLKNNERKIDAAYFSYSLHQINVNINEQIKVLQDTFDKLNVDNILLITISPEQMTHNILNINSDKLNEFDMKRFITKDVLDKYFNVTLYEEETNYINIDKNILIDKIQKRYISSLQILTDDEINILCDKIDTKYGNKIVYPDFYNYISLTKK